MYPSERSHNAARNDCPDVWDIGKLFSRFFPEILSDNEPFG